MQTNRFAQCSTCALYNKERQKHVGNKESLTVLDMAYKKHLEEIKYVNINPIAILIKINLYYAFLKQTGENHLSSAHPEG